MRLRSPAAPSDPRFLAPDWEPAYLKTAREGRLAGKLEAALRELEDCCACPRNCHVNGAPKYAAIARPPGGGELEAAQAAARKAGLWRLDERRAG